MAHRHFCRLARFEWETRHLGRKVARQRPNDPASTRTDCLPPTTTRQRRATSDLQCELPKTCDKTHRDKHSRQPPEKGLQIKPASPCASALLFQPIGNRCRRSRCCAESTCKIHRSRTQDSRGKSLVSNLPNQGRDELFRLPRSDTKDTDCAVRGPRGQTSPVIVELGVVLQAFLFDSGMQNSLSGPRAVCQIGEARLVLHQGPPSASSLPHWTFR